MCCLGNKDNRLLHSTNINEQQWSVEPSVQARCVRFCSCLCKVCSCASEAVLLTLQTLAPSCITITLPQTVRLFCVSLCSQAPQQQYSTMLSFSLMQGMATVTNWPLHVHYGITLWTYLSQTHRPNLRYCTIGIPSEPLVKDSHKRLSLTEKPQYCVLQVTCHTFTVTYVLWKGTRKHCTWRKWLTQSRHT